MTSKKKTRILLVDDHPIFCLGMSELINKEDDLEVCGSAESAMEARKALQRLKPDMAIVDISLKESDGIELVKEICRQHEGFPVLVVSMYKESLYAERALLAGARGYIMKQQAIGKVVKAIRHVLGSNIYASEAIREKVFRRLISPHDVKKNSPLDVLTNREIEVFRLIGEGLSSKEIADRINLSIKTIGTYRDRIKEKLDIKHYTELVKVAVHWNKKSIG